MVITKENSKTLDELAGVLVQNGFEVETGAEAGLGVYTNLCVFDASRKLYELGTNSQYMGNVKLDNGKLTLSVEKVTDDYAQSLIRVVTGLALKQEWDIEINFVKTAGYDTKKSAEFIFDRNPWW